MADPEISFTRSAVIQGNVLEYKCKPRYSKVPPSKRGTVTDFSSAARLRMLKHFQKINFQDHPEPLFLTLTYPDELAIPTLPQRNNHRKVMARYLERLTGAAIPAAWRIEWVPRKSGTIVGSVCPHWHWLIFKHRYISYVDINSAWKKTIRADGYVRTDIRRVDKRGCTHMYMAKYISKEAVPPSLVIAAYQNKLGRQYGWLRKEEIPLHPLIRHHKLSDCDRAALMRLAAERLPWINERLEQSFTLFGDVAGDAEKILTGEALDE